MKKHKNSKSIKKIPSRKFRVTYEKPFLPFGNFSQSPHYIKITEIMEEINISAIIQNLKMHHLYDNGELRVPVIIYSIKELENENEKEKD